MLFFGLAAELLRFLTVGSVSDFGLRAVRAGAVSFDVVAVAAVTRTGSAGGVLSG